MADRAKKKKHDEERIAIKLIHDIWHQDRTQTKIQLGRSSGPAD